MLGLHEQLVALFQVVAIDVVLAGDNAVIVGLAASRVAPEMRTKVIFWGITGAVVLRIMFAAVTTQLLAIVGLTLAGGILLLWVSWKMYREVAQHARSAPTNLGAAAVDHSHTPMGFSSAIATIIIADISMSLDNVLAVAGAAKGQLSILIVGLALSVVLMAVAASYIARLLQTYPWITWLGLAVILYVAVEMIWRGTQEVCVAMPSTICEGNLGAVIKAVLYQ